VYYTSIFEICDVELINKFLKCPGRYRPSFLSFLDFVLSWDICFLSFFLGFRNPRKKEEKKKSKKGRKNEKRFPQLLIWERKKKLELGMKMGKELMAIFLQDYL